MAVLALNTGLIPLAARAATRRTATKRVVAPKAATTTKAQQKVRTTAVAATPAAIAAPAFAASEALEQVALADVNILGVIATALFIIIPTAFLIVLYVKSSSEGNVSGGFSQEYYDKSKKRGDKKTNEAAVLKGKGLGMRPEK
ncbi:putative psbM, PSII-M, photosystem II polypeptide, typically encoded in the chloroplast genome [Ostreococcus lucimarinus CCE9901]|uniref:Putative psbM, PSII-M, photosystem II polypeptide, typically encoded in the chloroplast genome n=1 Tax=Ostreococcus lucimarinus (strain CCE9901) TaxID=436017 RepID=A4S5B8_OSTLU|nr:putative psbM, PSII-M, photosystem II polypeptide, typically encoded in the chloroplast genome [Ostreococcus lucimarinus CCE9901]ABO99039.1 putative psbM, PSII-M, photosystem II polypeptide, typically encoded in the chloroplast genome [Ostreococcus lucimarinus CCE9901]|eukprot:XP_001420746.1 putative psbM, PSII-M, photosystem II polypeptide, typically encoded in the chloroplast genome [Ostreococcus lucimarinus CCE9901]